MKVQDALIDKTNKWVSAAWRALPRGAGLVWSPTSETGLNILNSNPSKWWLSSYHDRGKALKKCIEDFHNKTTANEKNETDLWGGDHNQPFESLSRDHRLNLTSILLACNVSGNINALSNSPDLPFRNTKELDFWMSTKTNWWWNDYRGKTPPFRWGGQDSNSVEFYVRSEIENSWITLQKDYWSNDEEFSLRWENTAICAIDAIYNTIKNLEDASNTEILKTICQKTHELMVKHELWGDDTKNPDRTRGDGNPLSFDELSHEMKENYVLIVLAALSGVSDYMFDNKPRFA
jgi:hypothetical protein